MSATSLETTDKRKAGTPRPRLFLDKEGRWFDEGEEITHARTCLMLSQNLHRGAHGTYEVSVGQEACEVELEDTPYTVRSVTVMRTDRDAPAAYLLHLSDAGEELLAPETLRISESNVLYCRVKSGGEPARFLRPAYYQLCAEIQCDETGTNYWLPVGETRFHLPPPDDRTPQQSAKETL